MTSNQIQPRKRQSLLLLIALLILTALACQLSTVTLTGENNLNEEELVGRAVATISAEQEVAAPIAETDREVEVILPTAVPVAPLEADPALPAPASTLDLDLEETLVQLYQELNLSVVHIFVWELIEDISVPLGTGSGFIYDTQGHIVTNNHVVAGGHRIEVAFANGERRRATIVGTDVDSDLAVIKVDSLPNGANPIPIGNSDDVRVGQFVVAIGNPFGEAGSMSVGVVSGLGRTLPAQRIADSGASYSIPQVIQTDAAINPGNSGGPLLNLRGELVGVNSAILTRTGTNTGVGFSIPAKAVKLIVPELIEHGEYIYPFMGVSMAPSLTLDVLEEFGLSGSGIYVSVVVPDTPAARAGLIGCCTGGVAPRPGGDYIIAVDGNPLIDSAELISYLVFETKVGDTIELTVLRDGQEITVPLTLVPRP